MEWLIERLIAILPAIAKLSKEKRELADNALNAISIALNETSLYLVHIRDGGGSDRSREEQLARYWAAAAVPVRHLDRELAEMCQYKSEIWTNPDNWNLEKIAQYGIDINSVRDKYAELLRAA
ncbi:MAG: hypothetical protein J7K15_03895 [Deltaproteobacteria bacterium]|jgi:hypothetical protein|nr:hypothetical protein [Deltaproteobacteria bacterium]